MIRIEQTDIVSLEVLETSSGNIHIVNDVPDEFDGDHGVIIERKSIPELIRILRPLVDPSKHL